MKKIIYLLIIFFPQFVFAQDKGTDKILDRSYDKSHDKRIFFKEYALQSISYADYIRLIKENNLSYAAEKLNLSISEASISAAKVFNDPIISFEYSNNDDNKMMMGQGYSASISKTFSIAKRSARIDLAKSQKELSTILLQDYFRNLRAQATIYYLDAIKQQQLYELKQNSYQTINDLALGDSLKFKLGKITQINAQQSRLEANISYNELLKSKSELFNSYAGLYNLLGNFLPDTLYMPLGDLNVAKRNFDKNELTSIALENRTDLLVALQNIDVANKSLKLVKREKNTDFDVSFGFNHNLEVKNEMAPAPKFNGITLGLSIPLKFSNFNKGSVKSAEYQLLQAKKQYEQAQLQVKVELMQNLEAYISNYKTVENFNNGMLSKAKMLVDGKIYSYHRGESSLLEVLDAQRTYNEVFALYIESLYDLAVSLVNLEQSAGIWDFEL